MACVISSEIAELFISILKKNQPYPLSILDDLMFDDKRYDDKRLGATQALKRLIEAGYSEDDVNPWKK